MSKELEALDIIKNIGLSHMETSEDEDYDGEWEYTDYEEYDGTIEENYPEEIKILETALKNYEELLKRPCVLMGRTNGHTQALIDKICKNYKEVKITNLEDENKLKAFEIVDEKNVCIATLKDSNSLEEYNDVICYHKVRSMSLTKPLFLEQSEFDLLNEVLL